MLLYSPLRQRAYEIVALYPRRAHRRQRSFIVLFLYDSHKIATVHDTEVKDSFRNATRDTNTHLICASDAFSYPLSHIVNSKCCFCCFSRRGQSIMPISCKIQERAISIRYYSKYYWGTKTKLLFTYYDPLWSHMNAFEYANKVT